MVFHLQTVFEGFTANTPEAGPKEARKFGIEVPVAYDAHTDGTAFSSFMFLYGTGGTPWTTVIDEKGIVRYNGFTPRSAEGLIRLIDHLRIQGR